jgi:hypothetical protein
MTVILLRTDHRHVSATHTAIFGGGEKKNINIIIIITVRLIRRRWEDNIKMDIQEVGCGSMDWIELASG